MPTGLSKCGMGVSSRSAIVLEFDWPLRSRRASYSLGARLILGTDFGERLYRRCEKATGRWNLETRSPLVTLGRIPLQSKLKPRIPIQKLRLSVQLKNSRPF